MATVEFRRTDDGIPAPYRQYIEAAVSDVLRGRPATERWRVALREPEADGTVWAFEFTLLDSGRTESLECKPEDDDAEHEGIKNAVRFFLKQNWPLA